MNTYETGLFSEWRARMFLRCRGWRIIKSRHITGRNTGRAEIDIIARRGNTLAFIEVKCRPTPEIGINAITHAQRARLRRAAETYMIQRHWRGDARFDVILVCGWHIHWLRGAI